MKKTILFITEKNGEALQSLGGDYSIMAIGSWSLAREYLAENFTGIAAVVVDAAAALGAERDFLLRLRSDPRYGVIPALIFAQEADDAGLGRMLRDGATDVIRPGEDKTVIVNRIENAIRLKDSRTYYELESMLRELPCNIYLKDSEARYVFLTHLWHHLNRPNDPDWTPRGKTDPEVRKDKENAVRAYETDMQILKTGVGTRYTIEVDVDNVKEFLDITKRPVRDAAGNVTGIIALLYNVTEQELLKNKLRVASVTDGLTGLLNRGEIQRQINAALLSESGEPFSLIMVDIDNFKRVNDTFGHAAGDAVICSLAGILKGGESPEKKLFAAGRWGGEEFMLLLPNIQKDAACAIAETIRQSFAATVFPSAGAQTISLGVTQALPGDTLDTLCIRVDNALYRAKTSGKNRVEEL